MGSLCTWCGAETAEKFCSEVCQQDFETACRLWGAAEYEAERVSIFELRTCLGQHTRSLGLEFAPTTSEAPARSDAA